MFNVSQNGVRVALVRYSDEAEVVFGLGAQVNRYSLVATISSVYTSGSGAADSRRRRRSVTNGGSNPAAAINLVVSQVLNSARPGALKVLVTVADQLPPTTYNGLMDSINTARSANIRMYGVGIAYISGRSLDSNALYQLSYNADQGNPWQATWVYGYADLANKVRQVAQYACFNGQLLP